MVEKGKQNNESAPPPKVVNTFEVPRSQTPVANHCVIQYSSSGEFFLTFFEEASHTFTINDQQEWKFEDFRPICVGRVSMSITRIPGLIQSLQTCLDKFKKPAAGAKTETDANEREKI